jgi:hypothetical protein
LDDRVSFRLLSAKQLGQGGNAGSNAPCFIARQPVRSRAPAGFILEVDIRERLPVLVRKRCSAMILAKLFRTGGGNDASPCSRNPCRCGGDLSQRAQWCIGADCNDSKRRHSFPRAFDPRQFNRHELHDVLQLAVGELPNTLRLTHTAGSSSQPQL